MMQTKYLGAAAVALLFASATPANATVLTFLGITYELNLTSITNAGKTGNYTLNISDINVVGTDTELGRTGINGFAFTNPTIGNVTGGAVSAPAGFSFQLGGLNSSGCDGSGGFFCFKNVSATFPSPLPSSLSLIFSVTSDTAGSWALGAYDPHFKIDWVGSKNNYGLVSEAIPVNDCTSGTCPTPTPQGDGVPEPATWAMMLVGFGFVGAAMRRRKQHQAVRLTYA